MANNLICDSIFGVYQKIGSLLLGKGKEVEPVTKRGRKPKPTAIKALEGNPGKRDFNQN